MGYSSLHCFLASTTIGKVAVTNELSATNIFSFTLQLSDFYPYFWLAVRSCFVLRDVVAVEFSGSNSFSCLQKQVIDLGVFERQFMDSSFHYLYCSNFANIG